MLLKEILNAAAYAVLVRYMPAGLVHITSHSRDSHMELGRMLNLHPCFLKKELLGAIQAGGDNVQGLNTEHWCKAIMG